MQKRSLKTQFNQRYNQPDSQSNSIQNIATLTGLGVNFLTEMYKDTIKYPYTYNYYELDKKIPLPAFAMCRVYDFVLKNRNK